MLLVRSGRRYRRPLCLSRQSRNLARLRDQSDCASLAEVHSDSASHPSIRRLPSSVALAVRCAPFCRTGYSAQSALAQRIVSSIARGRSVRCRPVELRAKRPWSRRLSDFGDPGDYRPRKDQISTNCSLCRCPVQHWAVFKPASDGFVQHPLHPSPTGPSDCRMPQKIWRNSQ